MTVAFLLLLGAASALAGQPTPALDLSGVAGGLPAPADTGKPAMTSPIEQAPPTTGCLPPLPCGTRLFGAVRKDGAVELQVPALRW